MESRTRQAAEAHAPARAAEGAPRPRVEGDSAQPRQAAGAAQVQEAPALEQQPRPKRPAKRKPPARPALVVPEDVIVRQLAALLRARPRSSSKRAARLLVRRASRGASLLMCCGCSSDRMRSWLAGAAQAA